jgi:hypothetical protein
LRREVSLWVVEEVVVVDRRVLEEVLPSHILGWYYTKQVVEFWS